MEYKKMEYIRKEKNDNRVIRTELLLSPLLVIFPIVVSILFFYRWYIYGFLLGHTNYNGELIIGIIILISNLIFDIPFLKSIKNFKKI